MTSNNFKDKYISEDYNIIKKIGSGSFGEVYLTENKQDNTLLASKVEEKNSNSRLIEEYKIYKKLHKKGMKDGIPKIYNLIQTPKFNILIMELLGYNLDQIFNTVQKKFKLNTVIKLAIDIITLLENLHNTGFIHRDIKPNNFLIGYDKKDKLYIMDFGLSKKYLDSSNNHVPMKLDRSLVGTARYASINIHLGLEPSRRDDLESVGYMLVYFLKGSLPWQGIKKEKNVDQLQQIGDVKLCTNLVKLCIGLPDCFRKFIEYSRSLKFDSKPDYNYCRSLFIDYARSNNIVPEYEWMNIKINSECST